MAEPSKIALVTGAGSGIGRATALALARENYAVVLTGRRIDPLEHTAELARDSDVRMLVVPSDVSEPKSVSELFSTTFKTFGRLDLLFNNAGIGAPAIPLENLSVDQWQQVVSPRRPNVQDSSLRPATLPTRVAGPFAGRKCAPVGK